MTSLRAVFAPLKGTLRLVGLVMMASVIVVVVLAAWPAKGVAGDVAVTTTNFKLAMPRTLRAGRHSFAFTNAGTVPHEVLLFRTDLAGNALPLDPSGNVIETSPVLQKVLDSGNATNPGASESVATSQPLTPGHYVAVCNLPGHYRLGMYLDVSVG